MLLEGHELADHVEQGYEATTMEHIADRADLSRATVFNHFAQKAGIIEEWGCDGGRGSWRSSGGNTRSNGR
ncbi:helix-turn-helix domain-containing protein [Streptomyces sp. T028]|uniref:helix-turn-helix domain-containing protein n=1 Tax=Streptomyces sp. T028 TaxID=3394379 RepID=UPI003A8419B7